MIGGVMMTWSIPGADAQSILGNTHLPADGARAASGVVIIAHGFKGYKDYGMFPRIAEECARRGGLIAHRFNFSHSGMTDNIATFERPDLFERDTWNKQVSDLVAVLSAIARGELEGCGDERRLPLFVLGHSRGGTTALLTAGRLTYPEAFSDAGVTKPRDGNPWALAGVITLAAPSFCNPFSRDEEAQLLAQGWLESPTSRTGQKLRVGRVFLQEQLDDAAAHDVLAHVARIQSPVLVIHGENDPTVPAQCAEHFVRVAGSRATLCIIAGGDHVFNTPNPLPDDQPSSPQLAQVIDEVVKFTTEITRKHGAKLTDPFGRR